MNIWRVYYILLCREFSIFTMDVIAQCAFGITLENLHDNTDQFIARARAMFNPPVNRTPFAVIPCKEQNKARYQSK